MVKVSERAGASRRPFSFAASGAGESQMVHVSRVLFAFLMFACVVWAGCVGFLLQEALATFWSVSN
jgi:hypothetical protein